MIDDLQILVEPSEPIKRDWRTGHAPWGPAAVNASKTHCIRGHEFTLDNTRWCRRKKNGEKYGRICRTCHNEKMKVMMRNRIQKDPLYSRRQNLKLNYGITMEQYDAMVKSQNGVCAICLNPPTKGRGKKLYIDHCHTTDNIRGLLCNRCNSAIGLLDENPLTFLRALNYIIAFQHQPQPA